MAHKKVLKRYKYSILGYGFAYAGSLIGFAFIQDELLENFALKVGLAIIPVFFIVMMLRALWIYIRDVDEAQRFFIQRSINIAAFAVLIFSGSWGLLELMIDDILKVPVFWMFPFFFTVFGLATSFGPARAMNKC